MQMLFSHNVSQSKRMRIAKLKEKIKHVEDDILNTKQKKNKV